MGKYNKVKVHTIRVQDTNFYDENGTKVLKSHQMCTCGHSAASHVKSGLHPMDGYACMVRTCKCRSFKFDRIK